jgi:tetratricopeptide (TPR) repeat protein
MSRRIYLIAGIYLSAVTTGGGLARSQSISSGNSGFGAGASTLRSLMPEPAGAPFGARSERFQWDPARGFRIETERQPNWNLAWPTRYPGSPVSRSPETVETSLPDNPVGTLRANYGLDRWSGRWIASGTQLRLYTALFYAGDGLDEQAAEVTEQLAELMAEFYDEDIVLDDLALVVHVQMQLFGAKHGRPLAERLLQVSELREGSRSIAAGKAHAYLSRADVADGKREEALVHARASLEAFERRLPVDASYVISAKESVDWLSGKAVELSRPVLERKYGEFAGETAEGVLDDGRVLYSEGGWEAAVGPVRDYAAARAKQAPDDVWTVIFELFLAELHVSAEKYAIAKKHLQRTVELSRTLAQDRVPHLLYLSSLLSTLRGEASAAKSAFAEAEQLTAARWGSESLEIGSLRLLSPLPAGPGAMRRPLKVTNETFLATAALVRRMLDKDQDLTVKLHDKIGDPFFDLPRVRIENKAADVYGRLGILLEEGEPDEVPGYLGAVRIREVRPDTPAAVQGFRAGDRIVVIDKLPTVCVGAVKFVLDAPDKPLLHRVTYWRDGAIHEIYLARVRQPATN